MVEGFERGEDIDLEEVKTYTEEEKGEWDFIKDKGKKEILEKLSRAIHIQDQLLNADKKDYDDFVEKYKDDIPYMPSTIKINPYLRGVDSFINSLLSLIRYMKELMKEKEKEELKEKIVIGEKEKEELKEKEVEESKSFEILTKEQKWLLMYNDIKKGMTTREVSKKYGVSQSTVMFAIKKVNESKLIKNIEKKDEIEGK